MMKKLSQACRLYTGKKSKYLYLPPHVREWTRTSFYTVKKAILIHSRCRSRRRQMSWETHVAQLASFTNSFSSEVGSRSIHTACQYKRNFIQVVPKNGSQKRFYHTRYKMSKTDIHIELLLVDSKLHVTSLSINFFSHTYQRAFLRLLNIFRILEWIHITFLEWRVLRFYSRSRKNFCLCTPMYTFVQGHRSLLSNIWTQTANITPTYNCRADPLYILMVNNHISQGT